MVVNLIVASICSFGVGFFFCQAMLNKRMRETDEALSEAEFALSEAQAALAIAQAASRLANAAYHPLYEDIKLKTKADVVINQFLTSGVFN